jgi:hypothetical protein
MESKIGNLRFEISENRGGLAPDKMQQGWARDLKCKVSDLRRGMKFRRAAVDISGLEFEI